ncbi:MAG: YihY/virulence factor BrkB family protein [Actinomycetia bacterium]|nr:YihY/virulence factor BrkB family protein [Actinomycetes bacterium]MCP4961013.1 YihY/virulence factor BrkB family protein [Actinomycetes bacterium]
MASTRLTHIKDIVLEVKDGLKQDNVPVAAAGIAFFGFLSLFPALAAAISIYGLISDPAEITAQIEDALSSAPESTRDFLSQQLSSIANSASGGLGVVVGIGIFTALWSASAAVKHLIAALNNVYGLRETRGFVGLRGTALLFTVGAIVLLVAAIFGLAILPAVLAAAEMGDAGRIIIGIVRFPVLILLMSMAISVLFNLGPDRPIVRFKITTIGAIVGTIVWIAVSALLSIYTANAGKFSGGANTLGAITALLLWLYATAFSVLVGAEVDIAREVIARRQQQGERDLIDARYEAATRSQQGRAALGGALLGAALGAVVQKAAKK